MKLGPQAIGMEQNVGGLDRTARLVVGPILAVVGILILLDVVATSPLLGGALILVGAVFLVTGLTQVCIINRVLGINTREKA
jgi:hypothetical protein